MIVRILSASASFSGVRYNTDKIDSGKGELMKIANFGALQGLRCWRPEDLKNYLQAVSAQNKRVHFPQFHAVISAPGKAYDQQALAQIAEEWLALMGYAEQPYLLVYHKDTANNHIHIVSTRIGRDGKKISSAYENIRSLNNLQKVLGTDEKHSAQALIDHSLSYQFATAAQFKLLLETRGYVLREKEGSLILIKFGQQMGSVALDRITRKFSLQPADPARLKQVKALFHKYGRQYDTNLKYDAGWSSALAAYLKNKHGLELIFHGTPDKPPYGYTIIDHAKKAVYKGGQVMTLKDLKAISCDRSPGKEAANPVRSYDKTYYRALLKEAMQNYPDLRQGLNNMGFDIRFRHDDPYLLDFASGEFIRVEELLKPDDYEEFLLQLDLSGGETVALRQSYLPPLPSINLALDIDDEAIHGRNRHRKKKARTNTR